MPASFETTCGVISREQLVKAAELTIQHTLQDGYEVSDDLREKVMNVAHTAKKISSGWVVGDCGCLVGSLYLKPGDVVGDGFKLSQTWDLSEEELELGNEFPYALSEVIGRLDDDCWTVQDDTKEDTCSPS